jgi:hypothetical protein
MKLIPDMTKEERKTISLVRQEQIKNRDEEMAHTSNNIKMRKKFRPLLLEIKNKYGIQTTEKLIKLSQENKWDELEKAIRKINKEESESDEEEEKALTKAQKIALIKLLPYGVYTE